jgi:small conductance mechanosensitive channel
MDSLKTYTDQYWNMFMLYLPKLLTAIAVFIIGLWVINMITRAVKRIMLRRQIDASVQSFLASLINVSLRIILLLSVAGMLGLETTSFIAVVGAAGLAVGLALQGSLANFAGGVLTLVFKPFKVGDLIESGGQTGVVREIQIFNTILLTPDNKTVILPNGAVSNGTIINYSKHGSLRVDITIGVAPTNDIAVVRQVAMDVMNANPKVLKEPAPSVNVNKMGDGMITLTVRPYSSVADYWDVYFGVQEEIKLAFEKHNVSAPIPTRMIIQK